MLRPRGRRTPLNSALAKWYKPWCSPWKLNGFFLKAPRSTIPGAWISLNEGLVRSLNIFPNDISPGTLLWISTIKPIQNKTQTLLGLSNRQSQGTGNHRLNLEALYSDPRRGRSFKNRKLPRAFLVVSTTGFFKPAGIKPMIIYKTHNFLLSITDALSLGAGVKNPPNIQNIRERIQGLAAGKNGETHLRRLIRNSPLANYALER